MTYPHCEPSFFVKPHYERRAIASNLLNCFLDIRRALNQTKSINPSLCDRVALMAVRHDVEKSIQFWRGQLEIAKLKKLPSAARSAVAMAQGRAALDSSAWSALRGPLVAALSLLDDPALASESCQPPVDKKSAIFLPNEGNSFQ